MSQTPLLFATLIIGGIAGYLIAGFSYTHEMGEMDHMMNTMNSNLEQKSSAEFDKAFIDEMIVHHQGAIDMANLALTRSTKEEIKNLSKEIITAQESEIAQMKQWADMWFR